jgi:hypothetical protein
LVQDLREARTNSISQKQDASWGVHFHDSSLPHGYTFFKGDDYASRDAGFDRTLEFPETLVFNRVSLGQSKDIVFEKADGDPVGAGYLILQSERRDYVISINSFGFVEYSY